MNVRWVDVRVWDLDVWLAIRVLVDRFSPLTMTVDTAITGAGPEAEICIQGRSERAVRAVLDDHNIDILGLRCRIREKVL